VEPPVVAAGLTKVFGRTTVVDDVSIDQRAGSSLAIVGANGSGKTTLLHMLTGLIPPTSGSVSFAGISSADKFSRQVFGFAPDDLPLPTALTGREYLALTARLRGLSTSTPMVNGLLAGFDLGDRLDTLIGAYSHGMKRKLQLVAALAHQPEVLILDEPFRGLDPASMDLLNWLLSEFVSRGGVVIVATHDLDRAETYCSDVLIMERGVVVAQGNVRTVKDDHGAATLSLAYVAATGDLARHDDRRAAITASFQELVMKRGE